MGIDRIQTQSARSAKNRKRGSIKKLIHESLRSCIELEEVIDGSKIQKEWFPAVESQVFISHSRKDLALATQLADWLWDHFQIESFIDSFVWGYLDDLLKLIDDKYCLHKVKGTYDYKLRNYTTSHVHMMLATALTEMIDKTECLFFLNTPNSSPANEIKAHTYSPWIYHEIVTAKIIRETEPIRKGIKKEADGTIKKSHSVTIPNFSYDLELKNLVKIDKKNLSNWVAQRHNSASDALDWLYQTHRPNSSAKPSVID